MISFHLPNFSERLAGQKYSQGQMRKQNPSGMKCLAQGHGAQWLKSQDPPPVPSLSSMLLAPEPSAQTSSYFPGFCMPQAGLVGIIVCKVGMKVPLRHALVLSWTLVCEPCIFTGKLPPGLGVGGQG